MKKIILFIILVFGLFPILKNGKVEFGFMESAKAQHNGAENVPQTLYTDPCAGLDAAYSNSYNTTTAATNPAEQSGLMCTGPAGQDIFIAMSDATNDGTSSGWTDISYGPNGDPYITANGQIYEITALVHTHPNSDNGPSPTDQASLQQLNALGGDVTGMIIDQSGNVHDYSENSDGSIYVNPDVGTLQDTESEYCF